MIRKLLKNYFYLNNVIVIVLIEILILNWMLESGLPLQYIDPYRIIISSLFIFFTPGLLIIQIIKIKKMPWQAILAIASAISMSLLMILMPIPFFLKNSIFFYTNTILVIIFFLSAIVFHKKINNSSKSFSLKNINYTSVFHFFVIGLIAIAAYGFGENISDVDSEKIQHLQVIRIYYERTALLENFAVFPGIVPPNIIFYWEYLIAVIAVLTHTDPLLIFEHIRFIIPILGLLAVYLLIWAVLPIRQVNQCYSIILLLVLSGFILEQPTSLSFVNHLDATRGIFLFYGTAHHADPAMDILIPLLTALLWLSLKTKDKLWKLLFLGMLFVAFLWHPREYFQLAMTFIVLVMALALTKQVNIKLLIKRSFTIAIEFIVVALFFFFLIKSYSLGAGGVDEFAIKKIALMHLLDKNIWMSFRDALKFPLFFQIFAQEPNISVAEISHRLASEFRQDLWLIFAGISQIVVLFLGNKKEQTLALCHILFWFILLWDAACILVIALTYSEILITSPRLLYIFSYIVIAQSLLIIINYSIVVFNKMPEIFSNSRYVMINTIFFILGLVIYFKEYWLTKSVMQYCSYLLNFMMLVGIIYVVFKNNKNKYIVKESRFFTMSLAAIFLIPALWTGYSKTALLFVQSIFSDKIEKKWINEPIAWFSNENPFQLSEKMIDEIKLLPKGSIISANYIDKPFFYIYAPVYIYPIPLANVFYSIEERNSIRDGTHFIFNKKSELELGDVLLYLNIHNISYIVIQKNDYKKIASFFIRHSNNFKIIHNNVQKQELLIKCVNNLLQ